MNENEIERKQAVAEGEEHNKGHRPYWKIIHHSFIFWVFLVLMLIGITYYIMSVDFAFAGR